MYRCIQTLWLIMVASGTEGLVACAAQSSYSLDTRLIAAGDSMFVRIGEGGRRWYRVVHPSNVKYKSADPTILTIRPNGLAVARRPGWVEVEASWPGGRLRDNLYVLQPIADVRIEPHDTVLHIGDSVLVRTVAQDSSGAGVPIFVPWGYTAGRDTAAFEMLRTVHQSGVWIAARSVGEGRIWIELGPRVDTARVQVIE